MAGQNIVEQVGQSRSVTLRLMRSFYRHLEKSAKAGALAEAQREMRGQVGP